MTQRDLSGWLPALIGPVEFQDGSGVAATPRAIIKIVGGTLTDVPEDLVAGTPARMDITGLGGASVVDLSDEGVVDNVLAVGHLPSQAGRFHTVRVASTANLTLSGEQTIDGVLTSASRVFAKDQTTGAEKGIYLSAGGAWTREPDWPTGTAVVTSGDEVRVSEGTAGGGKVFYLSTTGAINVGTTSVAFTEVAGASAATTSAQGIVKLAGLFHSTSTADLPVLDAASASISGALAATHGGTGLTAYGTAWQTLGMNSGATALVYTTIGGDVTATGGPGAFVVVKVNGVVYPAGTATTVGWAPHVSVSGTVAYGPTQLDGGAGWVTGALPLGNVGAPTGTGLAKVSGGAWAAAGATLVDADVNAAAAIAGTKISPNFGSQSVQTTGSAAFGATTINGTTRVGDSARFCDAITLNVQTTNATQTAFSTTIALANGSAHIDVIITGRSTTKAFRTNLTMSYGRDAGTSYDIGTVTEGDKRTAGTGSTWSATITRSVDTVSIKVTGEAVTTIDWEAFVQVGIGI